MFQSAYKPERKYKRHDIDKLRDEESRVQSTLLEYGRRYGFSKTDQKEQVNTCCYTKIL